MGLDVRSSQAGGTFVDGHITVIRCQEHENIQMILEFVRGALAGDIVIIPPWFFHLCDDADDGD